MLRAAALLHLLTTLSATTPTHHPQERETIMAIFPTLVFTRSPRRGTARYWATDSATGSAYTIADRGDKKNRYHLTVADQNGVIVRLGRYATVTDASYEANSHLNGVREDRAQRTVIEHLGMDGSLLSVFANDFTGVTEVIINDEPGSGEMPRVLQLNREQVIALQSALGRVLDGTVAV